LVSRHTDKEIDKPGHDFVSSLGGNEARAEIKVQKASFRPEQIGKRLVARNKPKNLTASPYTPLSFELPSALRSLLLFPLSFQL
jgi:hypothetical protein